MLQDLRPIRTELKELEQIYNLPDWDLYELQDRIVSLEDILNNYMERHHSIDEYLNEQNDFDGDPRRIRQEFNQEGLILQRMMERLKIMKRNIFGYDTEYDDGQNSVYAEHSDPMWEDEPDVNYDEEYEEEYEDCQENEEDYNNYYDEGEDYEEYLEENGEEYE